MAEGALHFDAVVVPGGGLTAEGRPHPFVIARLDRALEVVPSPKWYICLSRGTTHRSPPVDDAGRPIDEAQASATYLIDRGISPQKILLDTWSLDTIGNAYFCRFMIAEQLDLARLLVVTSEFHMPRTRAIFEWVFGMGPAKAALSFVTVPDTGLMPEGALEARRTKEAKSLEQLEQHRARITVPSQLANFLFVEHGAYAAARRPPASVSETRKEGDPLLNTY